MSAPIASRARLALPPIVAGCLARLPQWPPSALLAAALTLALGRLLDAQQLAPLRGRWLELRVSDAGLRLRLSFDGRRFVPGFAAGPPADVSITASTFDFAQLALRRVDADSLFFNRRLMMEGDTELGLLVKNALDAVDLTALFPGPGRSAADRR